MSFGAPFASGDHSAGSEATDRKSADSFSSLSCKKFFLRISVTSSEGGACCGLSIEGIGCTASSIEGTAEDNSEPSGTVGGREADELSARYAGTGVCGLLPTI